MSSHHIAAQIGRGALVCVDFASYSIPPRRGRAGVRVVWCMRAVRPPCRVIYISICIFGVHRSYGRGRSRGARPRAGTARRHGGVVRAGVVRGARRGAAHGPV